MDAPRTEAIEYDPQSFIIALGIEVGRGELRIQDTDDGRVILLTIAGTSVVAGLCQLTFAFRVDDARKLAEAMSLIVDHETADMN